MGFSGNLKVLILLFLSIIVYSLRIKNQKLRFANEKKALNEEVFFTTQAQQENFQDGVYQERERISEELHDGVLSKLFGIRLSLGFFVKGQKDFEKYLDDLQIIESDIRTLSHDLKDRLLVEINSFEVYKNLITRKCDLKKIKPHISIDPHIKPQQYSNEFKVSLFRIFQEILQNILKHSHAAHVNVSFKQLREKLKILVRDDGIGFDVNTKKKGIGLKNLASRVEVMGGKINIMSIPGKGTEIKIKLNTIETVDNEKTNDRTSD